MELSTIDFLTDIRGYQSRKSSYFCRQWMASQRKHSITQQHSLYAIQVGYYIQRENILITNYQ